MRNYTLVIILLGTVCLLLVNDAYTQTSEDITITTYYPSPYGVYNELETGTLYFSEGANRLIAFRDTDNQYSERLRITAGESDTGNNDQGASIDLHGNNIGGDIHLVAGRAGNIVFWTSPAGTNAQDQMYILPNGNVGIGTAGPNGRLGVNGEINFVPQAAAPAGNQGDLYYDAVNGFRYYDGTGWQTFGGGVSWTTCREVSVGAGSTAYCNSDEVVAGFRNDSHGSFGDWIKCCK